MRECGCACLCAFVSVFVCVFVICVCLCAFTSNTGSWDTAAPIAMKELRGSRCSNGMRSACPAEAAGALNVTVAGEEE